MSSTSKSNGPKSKKFKFIPKAKRQRPAKQPTRNWLELPSDVMANILNRIGVHDILENAQKVCTAWRKICKDPAMWRVVYLDARALQMDDDQVGLMCKHAVDRSQGQLVDITIMNFGDEELLLYVANRSSQLRCLRVTYGDIYYGDIYGRWAEALKKFPLLEELSLYSTYISKEAIETAACYCPMLKTLKVNDLACWGGYDSESHSDIAIAIGENLRNLEHLELIGNFMMNIGLQTILDGCHHLKSLDLRRCLNIDLKGDLGKRCSERFSLIRLKLPKFSLQGFDVATKPKLILDDPDDKFTTYATYEDEYDYRPNDLEFEDSGENYEDDMY